MRNGFLSEKELKTVFWENYNRTGRAHRHQFECPLREGGADLVTVEQFQGNYQLNAFEFKLADIKKVILQAEANAEYVNKSWIVIPSDKENLINDKWMSYLQEKKVIGVICVEPGGRYKILFQPRFQQVMKFNQSLVNLMMKGY
ncbi:hypothetical protein [Traorella massiliensis]|uniref:hypothetical protein n=1 Tax=Traorella massiliensis TaxID=1903263 RepID=UPI0008F8128F|nr:hypothetical protein [Traorella massiliensis]